MNFSRASVGYVTTERLDWSTWLFTGVVAIAVNMTKLLDKSDYDRESVNSLSGLRMRGLLRSRSLGS